MKNKLHIMKAKPPVTEDEIKSYMNFDGVMQQHGLQLKRISHLKHTVTILASASVVAVTIYLLIPKEHTQEAIKETVPTMVAPVDSAALRDKPEAVITATDKQTETDNPKKATASSTQLKEESKPLEVVADKTTLPALEYVYHEAEPVEGYPHLYEYFSRELRYPKADLKDSIQGTVSVSFLINKEGKPEKIIIQNSLGTLFDQESMRLINNMPAWKPASLNGQPVAARISMPLTFMTIKPNTANKKQ